MKKQSIILFTAMAAIVIAFNAGSNYVYANEAKPLKSTTAKMKPAVAKKIEFDNDRPSIRKAYYDNLNQLADALKDEKYAVTLRGHADSVGRYKYNWVLSDNRAISVKNYLISKGIAKERIITTPFGSTVPIASNKTAAGRQKNRRVEIELKEIN